MDVKVHVLLTFSQHLQLVDIFLFVETSAISEELNILYVCHLIDMTCVYGSLYAGRSWKNMYVAVGSSFDILE
jgi:hypothetical protein